MKIRIKGNAVRFRLTRSEVEGISKESPIVETIDFGVNILSYTVKVTEKDLFEISYANNEITLEFPLCYLKEWQTTDKVGYQSASGSVSVLIEKDFTCLDNVVEDQSDNYPNPLLTKS